MRTNRRKRSALWGAALIALAAVCMIGCQNAADGNSNGGGNIPKPAVEKYAVAFDAYTSPGGALRAKVDGKEISPGDTVERGKIVEFTARPASGKQADEWFIEGGTFEAGSGSKGSDTAKVRVLNNIRVRVSFKDAEAGTHNVTFGTEGNAGGGITAKVAAGDAIASGNPVSDGSIVEFTAKPESGKTVDRWFIEGGTFEAGSGSEGSDTARVKVSGNISVRVSFKDAEAGKHNVTFGIEGNAGENRITAQVTAGDAIASGYQVSDGAFVDFTAVPAPGYTVKSWTIVNTDDGSSLAFEEDGTAGSLSAKAKVACNITVKVEFERILYTIVFGFEESSDQGTFTAQKDGKDFVSGAAAFYGEELTFSAQPKTGWKVAAWTIVNTDDGSSLAFEEGGTAGSLSAKAKVTCNMTVKVKFEKIICTVAFAVQGGYGSLTAEVKGTSSASASPIQVEYGKTVEFTATPDPGYKVKAWTVNGTAITTDLTYSFIVVQDVNLTVTFTEDNVRITIRGDERVEEGGYIDIPRGKTWGAVKTQIQAKFALKGEWQGGDYGAYQWKLNDENGKTIDEDYTFTKDTVVYAVTNYLKFRMSGTELTGYDGAKPRGRIIIDDTVTEIGANAFYKCTGLTGKLKLPASLTKIGSYAFDGCNGLTGELKLPAHLTEISYGAFAGCSGLRGTIVFPSSLKKISEKMHGYYDKGAFTGCTGITGADFSACSALTEIGCESFKRCTGLTGELKLPANLTKIGDDAFDGCTGLTGELKLPAGLTQIGEGSFSDCTGLAGELKLPAGLTQIGKYAFMRCTGLTGKLKLPAGLTEIGESAFGGCTKLTGVEFSAGLTAIEIGDDAFSGCTGLTGELKLPAGLTQIGKGAFLFCTGLTGKLKLPAGLTGIGGWAFEGCTGLTGVEFSAGLTAIEIKESAFKGCTGLTGVEFPAGLTKIEENAFEGCTGLTGVELPAGLTEIGRSAFSGCTSLQGLNFSACTVLEKIGYESFQGCTGLTGTIVFPASLKEIDAGYSNSFGTFKGCTGITGADFSACSALTKIDRAVFSGCSKLSGITLPPNLTSIGESAFSGCESLMSITLPPNLTSIGKSAFSACNRLETIVFSTGFPKIEESAFSGTSLKALDLSGCTACTEEDVKFFDRYRIETIKLPSNFTVISKQTFKGFWGPLLSLDFSVCTGITAIASEAFTGCTNIRSIKLPPNITTIGAKAFWNCKLESADLTACTSLVSIGESAFESCLKLTSADLSACTALTDIGNSAFSYCSGLKSVKFPVSLRNIEDKAFYFCTSLTRADLSGCTSLTKIFAGAFAHCKDTEEVMLPESITDIGRGAFGGVRFNFYEDILIYCKTVRIKGGSEFARIKALVIKSEYPESIIASY